MVTRGAMRAGRYYAVQQPLAAEAAGVVRQAVAVARLRGNTQVTPLHLATAMLSAGGGDGGLLRAACVRSQSSPLQCRVLELGFGIALGRLPMAAGAMLLHHGPALSNALVAALKRAEPSRRRRGPEADGGQQPQPQVAVGKVELGKLVVSVLDDPNVGRVMHEAGFSVSQVRANVEKAMAAVSSEQSNWASSRSNSTTTCQSPTYTNTNCSMIEPPSLEAAAAFSDTTLALNLGSDGELVQARQVRSRTGWPTSFVRAAAGDRERSCWGTSLNATSCRRQKFTELTAENLKLLCNALELRVPWHKDDDIVPEIAITVLRCRSGMAPRRRRRREKPSSGTTWLLFHGMDGAAKKAVAQELAKLVFGSYTEFASITLAAGELTTASSGSCRANTTSGSKQLTLKRQRRSWRGSHDEDDGYCRKMLFEAALQNPRRVIFIDGIEHLDHDSETGIKDAIADGRMLSGCNGGAAVNMEDAIVVLSCEVIDDCSLGSSPPVKQRRISRNDGEEGGHAMEKTVKENPLPSLDLNACADDGEEEEEEPSGDEGILNAVDGVFLFL